MAEPPPVESTFMQGVVCGLGWWVVAGWRVGVAVFLMFAVSAWAFWRLRR